MTTTTTYEVYYINTDGRNDKVEVKTIEEAKRWKNMMNGTVVEVTRKEIE